MPSGELGFHWCLWLGEPYAVHEFRLSVEAAHRLFPGVPRSAYSNAHNPSRHALRWIRAADPGGVHPWRAKLRGLMAAPFGHTVFLDNDVYLLRGDFVSSMRSAARVWDLAMPLDPVRAPDMPMGCTAIVSYRPERTRGLLAAALALLERSPAPPALHRWSDQEALWLAWTTQADGALRVGLLPEEYYCYWQGYNTWWRTRHRRYACFALHGHNLTARVLALQNRTSGGVSA